MITSHRLSLAEAEIAVDAALAKAAELGVGSVVCVCDAAGWPIAIKRPDNGKPTSVEIAINKAFTAACHRRPTHTYTNAQPGQEAFGIMNMHQGRFSIFVGGWPIEIDGEVVGGIGVSGGHTKEDIACCQAGITAVLEHLGKTPDFAKWDNWSAADVTDDLTTMTVEVLNLIAGERVGASDGAVVRAAQPGRPRAGRVDRPRSRPPTTSPPPSPRPPTDWRSGGGRRRPQRADVLGRAGRLLAERADAHRRRDGRRGGQAAGRRPQRGAPHAEEPRALRRRGLPAHRGHVPERRHAARVLGARSRRRRRRDHAVELPAQPGQPQDRPGPRRRQRRRVQAVADDAADGRPPRRGVRRRRAAARRAQRRPRLRRRRPPRRRRPTSPP